ncbi:hypothetical protein DRO24_01645 [Candidatus Bathyarchaeota archaeon]|nr:MAG: hypothetical protein DRO24_01645 [Candidatus Bathyarchaeota archaeon]
MDSIEKAILQYLMTRPDDFRWVMGSQVFDKQTTIRMFKRNKKFRKFIVENVVALATDLLLRGAEEPRK